MAHSKTQLLWESLWSLELPWLLELAKMVPVPKFHGWWKSKFPTPPSESLISEFFFVLSRFPTHLPVFVLLCFCFSSHCSVIQRSRMTLHFFSSTFHRHPVTQILLIILGINKKNLIAHLKSLFLTSSLPSLLALSFLNYSSHTKFFSPFM